MDKTQLYWDTLWNMGVPEEVIQVVTSINGTSEDTLNDIAYVYWGYRDISDMLEDMREEC